MLMEQIATWGEATFGPPANADALAGLETLLGHEVPAELAQILAETDGIEGEYGLGLLWSLERIARDNRYFRTSTDFADLYMPFDGLVFFADAGNGDQFAISLRGNQEIYVWDHETDSRMWVAPTIKAYLQGWMTGHITV